MTKSEELAGKLAVLRLEMTPGLDLVRLVATTQGLEVTLDLDRMMKAVAQILRLCADRISELENAIKTHRSQKADDRCVEDDDRLYEALGDGIKCDRRVGDKAQMLVHCQRFIEKRCEGGGFPSYIELEAKVEALEAELFIFKEAEKDRKGDAFFNDRY